MTVPISIENSRTECAASAMTAAAAITANVIVVPCRPKACFPCEESEIEVAQLPRAETARSFLRFGAYGGTQPIVLGG